MSCVNFSLGFISVNVYAISLCFLALYSWTYYWISKCDDWLIANMNYYRQWRIASRPIEQNTTAPLGLEIFRNRENSSFEDKGAGVPLLVKLLPDAVSIRFKTIVRVASQIMLQQLTRFFTHWPPNQLGWKYFNLIPRLSTSLTSRSLCLYLPRHLPCVHLKN